jgi:CspA family cold shock protein
MTMPKTEVSVRLEGHVARLRESFGFIRASDQQDYFFHRNDLDGLIFDLLQPGQKVSFLPTQAPKGLRATDVRGVR